MSQDLKRYMLVLLPLLAMGWFINAYYLHLLVTALTYAIILAGMNLLCGTAGQLSLGHAGLFAVGAYTSAILSVKLGWPVPAGMAMGIIVTMVCGLLLALPALRIRGLYLAIVTLAFNEIVVQLLNEAIAVTGGQDGIRGIPKFSFAGTVIGDRLIYLLILALFILSTYLMLNLMRSSWGSAFASLRHNEDVAEVMGIDTTRVKVLAFVISAAYAGLAGTLFAYYNGFVTPNVFTVDKTILLLLALIMVGMGTMAAPLFGGLLIVFLPGMLGQFAKYHSFLWGVSLIALVVGMPKGILGFVTSVTGRKLDLWDVEPKDAALPPSDHAIRVTDKTEVPQLGTVPLLDVRGVSKSFGHLQAVDAVDLKIYRGSIHALIGPNGAGKTTFLNIISGLYQPDEGEILINSQHIKVQKAHEITRLGVGRTFQHMELHHELSVLANVLVGFHYRDPSGFWSSMLGMAQARLARREAHLQAIEILALIGMEGQQDEVVANLPQGQQRLVGIARALMQQPALLLLDEPAAGLTALEIEKLREVILSVRQQGITVLLVEHRMDLVLGVADIITVLDHGIVLTEGAPDKVLASPEVIEAYLGQGGVVYA